MTSYTRTRYLFLKLLKDKFTAMTQQQCSQFALAKNIFSDSFVLTSDRDNVYMLVFACYRGFAGYRKRLLYVGNYIVTNLGRPTMKAVLKWLPPTGRAARLMSKFTLRGTARLFTNS